MAREWNLGANAHGALGAALALGAAILAGCDAEVSPGLRIEGGSSDANLFDGGPSEAGPEDASYDVYPPDGSDYPARYPPDRTHSPISPAVARALFAVSARAADLQEDVFAKVGASATVSTNFMYCFAGADVILDAHSALQPTLDHFLLGDAAGGDPYTRTSLSATVGWHAGRALEGIPPPIEQEVEATLPRFAVIMYGTNDINIVSLQRYADNMLDLTDWLLDRGVIPLLTTVMARGDSLEADAQVPRFNMIVRAIAEARQVPLLDLHRELEPLPNRGLGSDGIHPSVYFLGAPRGCDLSPTGLRYGYNVRNRITLEALDRLRRVLLLGEPAPDPPGDPLLGDGSPARPFLVDRLPFVHGSSTLFSDHRALNLYSGCAASQDESGPEQLYRLVLDAPRTLRVMVFDRGSVDVDLHLLAAPSEAECLLRDHEIIVTTLDAGTHFLSVDTFVGSDGIERSGDYLLVIMEE